MDDRDDAELGLLHEPTAAAPPHAVAVGYALNGINVFEICLGVMQAFNAWLPVGWVGLQDEMANAVVSLVFDDAPYITDRTCSPDA